MLAPMENWQLFNDPRFTWQFKYPGTAANGEPVERVETQFEGVLRVHVLSPTSREVYFEVMRRSPQKMSMSVIRQIFWSNSIH